MTTCECDLRWRRWDGFGRCTTCGLRYIEPRRVPRDPADQPLPTPSTAPSIIDLVLVDISDEDVRADIRERAEVGRQRYGQPLRAHNGRNALLDAYLEALDLIMYSRQALEEASNNGERADRRPVYASAVRVACALRRLLPEGARS